jgi:RNA polymerase sigma-70 factor (ECF subfamily)
VLLQQQDRSTWDRARIEEANAVLSRAMARMRPGPYQVQAVIAGYHANAATPEGTDWDAISDLYGQLVSMTRSPVVALNRAVATAMVEGPEAALRQLDTITGLDGYHLYHAARGELLLRTGDSVAADEAFRRARALTENPAERRHLDRRPGGGT